MTMITESLLHSTLVRDFELRHVDTSDHRDISNVDRFDVRNVYLALRHGLTFALALLRTRPDIVHVQPAPNRLGFLRDALFLIPARAARRTVVLHLHARGFDEFYATEPWWMRLLIRSSISRRWQAAVVSTRFRDSLGDLISSAHVSVLPNGAPDVGDGGSAAARAPIVLHLSTMWTLKGTFDVIEAAKVVSAAVPRVRFLMTGGWFREEERLEALDAVRTAGLNEVVEFVGPVAGPEKTELLRTAAVFTLPTRHPTEAQPVAVIEALASGTPVVATPVGAIPDMVRDGQEGFLVPVGDTAALGARLVELLTESDLRERMGRAARERYEQEYTMEGFVDRMGELWTSALTARNSLKP
jgi:glycosyltransferase involved in cell wall biosynthesis